MTGQSSVESWALTSWLFGQRTIASPAAGSARCSGWCLRPGGDGGTASVALAVGLAFFFGYSLTLIPLLRAGTALSAALGIALVADTLSIATMEIVDNAILLLWPGALDAGLGDALFWISLAIALASRGARRFSSTAR